MEVVMEFDDMERSMWAYEASCDRGAEPGMYIVTRLSGRDFTSLANETCSVAAPFDITMRDLMIDTVRHLMDCGASVIYGYTERDEISLLHSLHETSFSSDDRTFNAILAEEASAIFTQLLGKPAAFDCRVYALPNKSLVIDYFRWRMEDAYRNAINSLCSWKLRAEGKDQQEASPLLSGMDTSQKKKLLSEHGIDFNDLPMWQLLGMGVYFANTGETGIEQGDASAVSAGKRELIVDMELPVNYAYATFLNEMMHKDETSL